MNNVKKVMLVGLLAVATVQEMEAIFSLKNIVTVVKQKLYGTPEEEEWDPMEYWREVSRNVTRCEIGGVLFTGSVFALCGLIDYATKKEPVKTDKEQDEKDNEKKENVEKVNANLPLKISCFAGAGACALASAAAAALELGLPWLGKASPYHQTGLKVAALSSAGLSYYLFKRGLNY